MARCLILEERPFDAERDTAIMAEEVLELPALGKPFQLGTLYNANKNQIVPSMPLWDMTNTDVVVIPRISHETNVTTTDSLASKMQSLNIKGNLVISALANKLEVKGSAAVLNDNKSSKTEAKIQLEARGTKEYHTISKNHLAKENLEQYHEFINQSGATHIVIGISYGYQIFLILETTCESEHEKLDVAGLLGLKIMSHVEGEVQGSYKTNEEKALSALKVKIHGSVRIPSNPTSLKETIEMYKRIPEFVTNNECPMTVHLLPLASVLPSLPFSCSQMNETVLSSVTVIFDDIEESEVTLTGIQTSDLATMEPRIRQKAKKLSAMLTKHKIWLQMKLNEIISNPRMDTRASKSMQIQNVVTKHKNSPFSSERFGMYLLKMEKEERFLKNLMKMLTFEEDDGNSGGAINKHAGEGKINRISIDILSDETDGKIPFERCKVFVLEVPIITVDDDLLEEMEKYDPDEDTESKASMVGAWPFEDEEFQWKILKCCKKLVNFARTHQNGVKDEDTESTKFRCVFTGFEKDREPSITLYSALTGDIEPS
ncbi:hypothetical protein ACJMK2_044637 [Sinanodonta woodiana]|uniref:SNTX thioredoxin-like domain-containing protein n=1 Tax=Sinanodonta woodiana TaxID=1069815 RepID=A0ABD3W1J7_SINWO